MKEFYKFLQDLGIDLGPVLAGTFGVAALLSKPNEMNRKQKALTGIAGIGSANYLTPLFLWLTHIPKEFGFSIAFVLGYMGLKGIELIILSYKKKKGDKL